MDFPKYCDPRVAFRVVSDNVKIRDLGKSICRLNYFVKYLYYLIYYLYRIIIYFL
jgi:hypothetical protein